MKLLTSVILTGLLFSSAQVFAEAHTVVMKSISFEPKSIEIKVGDSVQWNNKSLTEHSATAYEDENKKVKFDTGSVKPGKKSEKIEFKTAGLYLYHCSVHGKSMSGKINVIQ